METQAPPFDRGQRCADGQLLISNWICSTLPPQKGRNLINIAQTVRPRSMDRPGRSSSFLHPGPSCGRTPAGFCGTRSVPAAPQRPSFLELSRRRRSEVVPLLLGFAGCRHGVRDLSWIRAAQSLLGRGEVKTAESWVTCARTKMTSGTAKKASLL